MTHPPHRGIRRTCTTILLQYLDASGALQAAGVHLRMKPLDREPDRFLGYAPRHKRTGS